MSPVVLDLKMNNNCVDIWFHFNFRGETIAETAELRWAEDPRRGHFTADCEFYKEACKPSITSFLKKEIFRYETLPFNYQPLLYTQQVLSLRCLKCLSFTVRDFEYKNL